MNNQMRLIFLLFIICGLTNVGYTQNSDRSNIETADSTAYLKIDVVDQDSVFVVINNEFSEIQKVAAGDSLAVKTGSVHLRVIQKHYLDYVRSVNLGAGETQTYLFRMIPTRGSEALSRRSSYPRLFWEANHFIQSDPQTDLYLDGQLIGTHYATVNRSESFEIRGVHITGKEFTKTFHPERQSTFHFHQNYLKPSRGVSWLLSIVPGASQAYKKQTLRAVAFSALTLGGAALAYSYETRYQDSMDKYNRLNIQYGFARNPQEAFVLGNEAEEAYNESVSIADTRNSIIYGTVIVYLANIVDGFIAPSIGYRDKRRSIDPYLDFDPAYKQPVIGIKSSF